MFVLFLKINSQLNYLTYFSNKHSKREWILSYSQNETQNFGARIEYNVQRGNTAIFLVILKLGISMVMILNQVEKLALQN